MSIKDNVVKFNDLNLQWKVIREDFLPRFNKVMETSSFINGADVQIFEENFAKYIGCNYACGVSNGTDAIKLCVEALDLRGKIGVFIPANTFIATILGVEMAFGQYNENIEYILIDCDEYFQIDVIKLECELKKNRTKWDSCIIMPVHLYGNATDMRRVMQLSEEHSCFVIEDCSQSHGTTTIENRKVGTYGHMAAFSLYPGKNLGAAGDAGVITTNDKKYYDSIKLLQNWGAVKKYYYDRKGYNNRLDTIQAIIVDEKLKHLDDWNKRRSEIASWYEELIKNPLVTLPKKSNFCETHTYHIYPILLNQINRENLMKTFDDNNIQCGIHYPVPIEETKIYNNRGWYNENTRNFARKILSLPMHPFLTLSEVQKISQVINKVQ